MVEPMHRDERYDRPVPDPTLLTTESLLREILHLRELLTSDVERIETLYEARFTYIEQRFRDRDLLVSANFDAGREAVAAALSSSKEAVGKSEATFTKQLDSIQRNFETANSGVIDQITALKERVTTVESETRGAEKKEAGLSSAINLGIASLGVLISITAVIVAILSSR